MTAQSRAGKVLLPHCTPEFELHSWCKPQPVYTRYGDQALPGRRCDCECHRPRPKAG
ncbi:hypothetical protein [Streptomyces sp. NPDC051909]|uniref:hypothetical protein n=1 Tax=Streptomyces sp. NPDC051909 TaxID=3154944 RepID=UPI00342A1EFB